MLILKLRLFRFLSLEILEISDILLSQRLSSVRLVRNDTRQICSFSLLLNPNSVVCLINSQLKESKFLFEASSQTSGGTFISKNLSTCSKLTISSFLEEPKCFSRSFLLLII
ncbi:Hypothetical_protein [Hexamita inflata]|uniref:Hypothetical_protein n=1 Tax=Hexamita inflata TaxID=28002 RepID=A0AA86TY73_9EUKA|nr:Hypothetical protein HINF_LOCUS21795 [Hexamita inflata]